MEGVRALERSDCKTLEGSETEDLIVRAQGGDAGAFQSLYLRYYDLVYRYGRAMLKDPHEAEDVTQDVFMRVMKLLPGYEVRADRPFAVLLMRIARNRSIDCLRKQKRCDIRAADDVAAFGLHEDPPGAFDDVPDVQLRSCLTRLPLAQRQVLVLRYVLDFSPTQVAEVVGATPQAVRNLQYRGLRGLRAQLAAY